MRLTFFLRSFAASALLIACFAASAQTGRGGSISGVVCGPDGVPIASAQVTITGPDGHPQVSRATPAGTFAASDLVSGSYNVQASATGFRPTSQGSIAVAVGHDTHLEFVLAVGSASETVQVTAAAQSAFDTMQTSSVVNVDRDRVEELPIPNRNYLTFVALSPQATAANPVFAASTRTQSGGGFGFGGLRPGSNAVRIDGVSDDDEFSGDSRTQLSPEAINDFQIVNHGFAAESGGAAGGAIDVQTRTGTDTRHGDVFVFVQNGALNATPPLGLVTRKPEESRVRAGVAMGGALVPGKLFYYMAAEQEIAHGEETGDLRARTVNTINTAIAGMQAFSGLTLTTGFTPITDEETEFSGRIDRTLTTHQALMLRYAFTNTRNVADAFNSDEFSDRSARGSSFNSDNSLNGTLTSSTTSGMLNKLSFEVAQRRAVERTRNTATPGILIPGVALLGTPFAGNNRRFETDLELEDTVWMQHGQHLLQAGAGVDRVGMRAQVLDGSRGLYVFPTLAALSASTPDLFVQSFLANPNTNFREYRLHVYAQDHWKALPNLVLDAGLRYDDNLLPGGLPQDAFHLSPRLGLAYTPRRTLMVRAGFGLFDDRFLLSTLNRLAAFDGTRGFSQVVEDTAAGTLFRAGTIPQQPLPGVAPSRWQAQPGLRNAYSEVASLGVEQELPLKATLKLEYQFVRGIHLGRTRNVNLTPPVVLSQQNAALLGVSSPTPQQLGRLVFEPQRVQPAYDAVNQFESSAGSVHHGATLTLNRQFTDDFQLLAGYTFSKTIDDASSNEEQPQNPFDLRAERALSLQDQRHRLTLSGLWLIGPDLNDPQDAVANANPGRLMRLLTGLEFAPILSVACGFRENAVTAVDSNREHIYPFAARPMGLGRNSLVTPAQVQFDFRVLKTVPLGRGHLDLVAESFNLINHRNVSLLNTAYGSDSTAALGFGRPSATGGSRRIQFSLDYEF